MIALVKLEADTDSMSTHNTTQPGDQVELDSYLSSLPGVGQDEGHRDRKADRKPDRKNGRSVLGKALDRGTRFIYKNSNRLAARRIFRRRKGDTLPGDGHDRQDTDIVDQSTLHTAQVGSMIEEGNRVLGTQIEAEAYHVDASEVEAARGSARDERRSSSGASRARTRARLSSIYGTPLSSSHGIPPSFSYVPRQLVENEISYSFQHSVREPRPDSLNATDLAISTYPWIQASPLISDWIVAEGTAERDRSSSVANGPFNSHWRLAENEIPVPTQHHELAQVPDRVAPVTDIIIPTRPRVEASPLNSDRTVAARARVSEGLSSEDEDEWDWTSDYSETTPTMDSSHPLAVVKDKMILESVLAFQAWKQRQQVEEQAEGSRAQPPTPDTGSVEGTPVEHITHKRRRQNNGDDEDDERHDPSRQRLKRNQRSTAPNLSLACPFAKKSPLKYRSCFAKTISRIQDVKLHLSRCHQPPIHCYRCKSIFATEAILLEHAEAEPQCPPQRTPIYDGVTRDQ